MTLSKSNFIAISITLFTILFLFQFTNLALQYTSKATKNEVDLKETMINKQNSISKDELETSSSYKVAIIGEKTDTVSIAEEWCEYSKFTYYTFSNLKELDNNFTNRCKLLIVTNANDYEQKDFEFLVKMSDYGINIIFTSLPDIDTILHSGELSNLLGIKSIGIKPVKTNGFTMFEGFLLGGRAYYKSYKKSIPYFHLKTGTKKYMIGNIKNQKKKGIKNEDLPTIIWRNKLENSFVFASTYNFFGDHTALGMYTSMYSDTSNYNIYPVVNAQTVAFQNFPYLSSEKLGDIEKHYYHTSKSFCENVLLPDIVSILDKTNDKFTGFIAPKLEYKNNQEGIYNESTQYFFKQAEKISGELGISGDQMDGINYYQKKLDYDSKNLQKKLPDYKFTIFSPGDMPESIYKTQIGKDKSVLKYISTILANRTEYYKPIFSYFNDNVIKISNTTDGFTHKNEDDIYLRSIETALGYSSTSLDFRRVLYPESNRDDWTRLSKNFARFQSTYWNEFRQCFDSNTVSEAGKKVRNFLAINYISYRQDDTLTLSISNFDKTADFILSLNNERIKSIDGATYKKIEKDRYLISASQKDVVINLSTDIETN